MNTEGTDKFDFSEQANQHNAPKHLEMLRGKASILVSVLSSASFFVCVRSLVPALVCKVHISRFAAAEVERGV